MARGRRFEVKNEMRDVKKIRPDDSKQTGGQASIATQEEAKKEAMRSGGFDDDIEWEEDVEETLEEYREANAQVESEIEQYYYDEKTQEELKTYIVSKISEIYGTKLEQCNISVYDFVEGFFERNEFNGVETYRQLIRITEETIEYMKRLLEDSQREEASKETGIRFKGVADRDILPSAVEATEEITSISAITGQARAIKNLEKDRMQTDRNQPEDKIQ